MWFSLPVSLPFKVLNFKVTTQNGSYFSRGHFSALNSEPALHPSIFGSPKDGGPQPIYLTFFVSRFDLKLLVTLAFPFLLGETFGFPAPEMQSGGRSVRSEREGEDAGRRGVPHPAVQIQASHLQFPLL